MLFISTKAQAWVPEFAFALMVFLLCIGLFYNAYPNIKRQSREPLEEVYFDAKALSEMLVSPGLPQNWTEKNVRRPGLTKGEHKLVKEKVLNTHNLSKNNYTLLKSLTGVQSDFAIYFLNNENKVVDFKGHGIFGNPRVNLNGNEINFSKVNAGSIARVERSLMYKQKPVRLIVTTWSLK